MKVNQRVESVVSRVFLFFLLVISIVFITLSLLLFLVFDANAEKSSLSEMVGRFETSFYPYGSHFITGADRHLFVYGNGFSVSYDGGYFWSDYLIGSEYPSGSIYSLVVSPDYHQDKTLFAGMWYGFENSMQISNDGGKSWRSPSEPFSAYRINDIAVSPDFTQDKTVFAVAEQNGSEDWIVKSQDSGETWENVAPSGITTIYWISLSSAYASDQMVIVRAIQDGVDQLLQSTDAGDTWAPYPLNTNIEGDIWQFLFSPDYENDKTIFLRTSKEFLYRSKDGGQNWQKIADGLTEIAVSPDFATSQTLLGIDDWQPQNLLQSVDGGRTWHFVYDGGYDVGTADVRDISYPPDYETRREVYIRVSGKVGVSKDGGATWSILRESDVQYFMTKDAFSPTALVDGRYESDMLFSPNFEQDGIAFFSWRNAFGYELVMRTVDFGDTWQGVSLSESVLGELAISPNFIEDQTLFLRSQNKLFKSFDLGENWVLVSESLPIAYGALKLSPTYGDDLTVFAGAWGEGVYKSMDDGVTWAKITDSIMTNVTDFEIAPYYSITQTLIASTYSNGVFRSDNDGLDWSTIADDFKFNKSEIVLSPVFQQDNTIFLLTTGSAASLWRSQNGGASWNEITGPLDAGSIWAFAVSPKYDIDETILLSQGGTPLISEDSGTTWSKLMGMGSNTDFLATAYVNNLLTPFALGNDVEKIYRYRWPKMTSLFLCARAEPGSPELVTLTLPLQPDEYAPVPWKIVESADWFSVEPDSGVLPAVVEVIIDPSIVSTNVSDILTVESSWSQLQVSQLDVQVMLNCWDAFLPIVEK